MLPGVCCGVRAPCPGGEEDLAEAVPHVWLPRGGSRFLLPGAGVEAAGLCRAQSVWQWSWGVWCAGN